VYLSQTCSARLSPACRRMVLGLYRSVIVPTQDHHTPGPRSFTYLPWYGDSRASKQRLRLLSYMRVQFKPAGFQELPHGSHQGGKGASLSHVPYVYHEARAKIFHLFHSGGFSPSRFETSPLHACPFFLALPTIDKLDRDTN
jgi:hypothetical protein